MCVRADRMGLTKIYVSLCQRSYTQELRDPRWSTEHTVFHFWICKNWCYLCVALQFKMFKSFESFLKHDVFFKQITAMMSKIQGNTTALTHCIFPSMEGRKEVSSVELCPTSCTASAAGRLPKVLACPSLAKHYFQTLSAKLQPRLQQWASSRLF